ncbi:MAG: hypothetical protein GOVbin630_60 [Prokaryotic dsDNA virus sp.]|nr:MAG: hypothetical protein GOVbin630_60 [Prokaryotic dsDNA virus sp.]|tara:strand:- start:2493 stop:2894 length:402 start_codon:yes stop_codon:yes gene_type:complete
MTNKNKKDPNQIAYIEKAIAKKFGKEAIINPKSGWTDEKEKEYLEQLNEFYSKKRKKSDENEKVDKEGFLLSKNLLTKESDRVCPTCEEYSFSMRDDLYMNKFECCWKCYIQWVEGREERWTAGWRPIENEEE